MELLVLFMLILLNGVFAMAEMAVVAARRARLQQWADEGRAGASAALALATEPGHFLSTIQIGITVIGIVSGAFAGTTIAQQLGDFFAATAVLAPHAHTLALVIVVSAIAVCSLVIGELAPKRIALLHPEAIATVVARPMKLLSQLTFPLVKVMSLAAEGLLRLFGGSRAAAPVPVTQEEIAVLMRQGAAAGVFEQHEPALVSRVLDMDARRVTGVMTPRVDIEYLDLGAPFEANRATLLNSASSRFPLCRGGLEEIIGIVEAKELLQDALQGRPIDLSGHAQKPLYVPDGLTVTELLEAFKKHRSHLALVVDEYGEIQGLVTLTDVMEALVGDIGTADETADLDIVRRDDGSWLVDGAVTIHRLKESVDLDDVLSGEDSDRYETLAGFVLAQLRRMPRPGDKFDLAGRRFEVVDMDRNRVDKVLIARAGAPRGDTEGGS
ncbi:MAG TPA: hemolysin family protein [Burkholderiaceae bacterium]|nr:hemolysin family protein [Burkholderiaceae bacterium]